MLRLAVLPLLLLLGAGLSACSSGADDDAYTRVLLVGVDGASWTVMAPLIDRGELPNFARLMERGAYMRRFETMQTTRSPEVWTSVATGRPPQVHGIVGFTETLPSGKKIPVSSNARKAKALWELTDAYGLTAGVLGWWASWPAEEFAGYVVTDHANRQAVGWQEGRYWTADPDLLSKFELDYRPADLGAILAEHWLDRNAFPYDELQRRSGINDRQLAVLKAAPWDEIEPYAYFKTFFAIDYPMFTLAQALRRQRPTDLQMLYLRGPDPIQHQAWDLVEPEKYANPPEHLERDRGLVQGVYRVADSFLGDILESMDPRTTLIVASDHGAEAHEQAATSDSLLRPGEHSVAAKGVLFIYGPEVRAGRELESGNPLDLMPTIAWLLGIPLADNLAGERLTDAFEPTFVAEHPIETVHSYGRRQTRPSVPSDLDEELLEQLKALGYIK